MEYKDIDEYMEVFRKFSLFEKRDIVFNQLKLLASLSNKMCEELNVNNEIITSKELLDVTKDEYSEDDFLEAIIILVNSIQNSLCDFDLKLSEIMEKQRIDLN